MLIHPWDAATGSAEWQDWLASTDRFGMLAVNNLDPARCRRRSASWCGTGAPSATHRLSSALDGRVCRPASSGTTATAMAMSKEMARSSRNGPSAW